jgi:hypothetical protein
MIRLDLKDRKILYELNPKKTPGKRNNQVSLH